MYIGPDESCPLPSHPLLAKWAVALNATGHWAELYDADWHGLYMTDEGRRIYGRRAGMAPYIVGARVLSPEAVDLWLGWPGGQYPLPVVREAARMLFPWLLAHVGGDRERLRAQVDPRLHDIVDEAERLAPPDAWSYLFPGVYSAAGGTTEVPIALFRVRDESGRIVGVAQVGKPAVGMSVLTRMASLGDRGHFDRVDSVASPGRRAGAILFVDLESSSSLARQLSTSSYFALVRRLARAADESVVQAGGLVGQHAGDGVVGFFLAETAGSESAAARACIDATRALQQALPAVAQRCELTPEDVVLRYGLHWGANLYVGQIATVGRTEVTALGDQVNEAARVEACATGGRTLATKDLVERLDEGDATAIGVDPSRLTYTRIADLSTATEKARRDAPALAVCEL